MASRGRGRSGPARNAAASERRVHLPRSRSGSPHRRRAWRRDRGCSGRRRREQVWGNGHRGTGRHYAHRRRQKAHYPRCYANVGTGDGMSITARRPVEPVHRMLESRPVGRFLDLTRRKPQRRDRRPEPECPRDHPTEEFRSPSAGPESRSNEWADAFQCPVAARIAGLKRVEGAWPGGPAHRRQCSPGASRTRRAAHPQCRLGRLVERRRDRSDRWSRCTAFPPWCHPTDSRDLPCRRRPTRRRTTPTEIRAQGRPRFCRVGARLASQ